MSKLNGKIVMGEEVNDLNPNELDVEVEVAESGVFVRIEGFPQVNIEYSCGNVCISKGEDGTDLSEFRVRLYPNSDSGEEDED